MTSCLPNHLQRWQGSNDPLLADLCRRVVNRDLLKTLEVTRLSETEQTVLLGDVRTYLEDQGYSSQHYLRPATHLEPGLHHLPAGH